MKINLEQIESDELEIVIRGNLSDPKITEIISAIQATNGSSKLFLWKDEKEYLFEVGDISYFIASQNKIYAHVEHHPYEIHFKLYELADMLYARGFIQINKSTIVNTNAILSVEAEFSGNYIAILKDHITRLTISRKYIKSFRKYIMEVK